MKKKFLKFLAVCLIFLFTATTAYAREENSGASNTTQGHYTLHKNKKHDSEARTGSQGKKGSHGTIISDDDDDDDNDNDNDEDEDEDEDEDDDGNENEHENKSKSKGKDQDRKVNSGGNYPGYVAVTGITLSKNTATLAVKSWERLNAAVQPANATDKKYFWFSSNPRVVSVNPSGKITGLASGTAVIYAATRDGFKTASCTVNVQGPPAAQVRVIGVQLSNSALTLDAGNGKQLTAAVIPGNAFNKAVTWHSSNPNVATVNQNGYVYGVDDGTAVITVRTVDGGKTAACAVTVRHRDSDIHVASVSIIRAVSSIALKEGALKHLDAQVLPENASNKNVIWQTSDASIVSVDQNGYITGVHAGTATVTAIAVDGSNKQDTCTVRVIPAYEWVSVTGISLNLISTTIPAGLTDTLRYEIGPANATDQDVRWSSSNSAIAAVDAFGRIEAKAAGTVVITAATVDGGKTASCLVMVTPRVSPPSHGILLNKTASTLLEGKFDYPAVIFYPANENYSLTWTSGDTAVAVVDQNGRVTAKGQGTVVITVTTSNHWSVSYIVSVVK